ncbi:MAG: tetratricopeptide repeat protein [Candidatus Beckwithbacteria bacterium]|nr:tetratricopeptide repeat protein [Patescibacteria group bacterium]
MQFKRIKKLTVFGINNKILLSVLFVFSGLFVLFFLKQFWFDDWLRIEFNIGLIILYVGLVGLIVKEARIRKKQKKVLVIWLLIFISFFYYLARVRIPILIKNGEIPKFIISSFIRADYYEMLAEKFINERVKASNYQYQKGLEIKKSGDIDRGANIYNKAIKINSDYYNPYAGLAIIYLEEGNCSQAKKILDQVFLILNKLNDKGCEEDCLGYFYGLMGGAYSCYGQYSLAVDYFSKSLLIKKTPDVLHNYGLALYNLELYDQAQESFIQVINWQNHEWGINNDLEVRVSSLINLGMVYYKLEDIEKAKKQFLEAINLEGDNAVAHNNYGHMLTFEGRLEEATAEFKLAIKLDPNLIIAQENLVIYSKKLGE